MVNSEWGMVSGECTGEIGRGPWGKRGSAVIHDIENVFESQDASLCALVCPCISLIDFCKKEGILMLEIRDGANHEESPTPSLPKCVEMALIDSRSVDAFGEGASAPPFGGRGG